MSIINNKFLNFPLNEIKFSFGLSKIKKNKIEKKHHHQRQYL